MACASFLAPTNAMVENNLSILAYSPLERGLLSGKMTAGYKFEEGDHRQSVFYFNEENLKRTNHFLDKIKHLAVEKNATLAQLVISWTLSQPGITIALVGARNEAQAIQNAQSIKVSLTADQITFINTHLNQLELIK
jgi:aryl-alcohol dehydrogenase-like predicted oxidoreductase